MKHMSLLRKTAAVLSAVCCMTMCIPVYSADLAAEYDMEVRLRGEAEMLFEVPRDSFYPAPNVDSAVIRITPYETPPCTPEQLTQVLRVVKAGFAQRRKTAVNALSSGLSMPKKQITAALASCGQKETVRFEQLDSDTLLRLTNALFSEN